MNVLLSTLITRNITNVLANEGSLERNGQVLMAIANQLRYAGVEINRADLVEALDSRAEANPSVFGEMPELSSHEGPWGPEFRLRPSAEVRTACRAGVDAIYAVTDTMDRTERPVTLKDGQTINLETVRPMAFAKAMGHLRLRWAAGNFTTPKAATIRRWVGIA